MTTVTGFEQRPDGLWDVHTVRTGRKVRVAFAETVAALHPYYIARAFGGLLYLLGGLVMAYNIWMTIRGKVRDERPIIEPKRSVSASSISMLSPSGSNLSRVLPSAITVPAPM